MAVPGTTKDVLAALRASMERAAAVRSAAKDAAQQVYQQPLTPPPPAQPVKRS